MNNGVMAITSDKSDRDKDKQWRRYKGNIKYQSTYILSKAVRIIWRFWITQLIAEMVAQLSTQCKTPIRTTCFVYFTRFVASVCRVTFRTFVECSKTCRWYLERHTTQAISAWVEYTSTMLTDENESRLIWAKTMLWINEEESHTKIKNIVLFGSVWPLTGTRKRN